MTSPHASERNCQTATATAIARISIITKNNLSFILRRDRFPAASTRTPRRRRESKLRIAKPSIQFSTLLNFFWRRLRHCAVLLRT
jgi:hypothetical protein